MYWLAHLAASLEEQHLTPTQTWGRLELGIFHKDSSIHLHPTRQLLRYKKLLKSWALRFAPCVQLYEINPLDTQFYFPSYLA